MQITHNMKKKIGSLLHRRGIIRIEGWESRRIHVSLIR